ncbi:L-alanine-DL-glutamate epimerase [Modestobacter sp. DSM 44400]|uniref:enolase C-terminal domain-like protein n=1 Tax=Modestobacter sp. DSM 44400 TaxID=1550230 RepID=UPI000897477E|nr:enolase C-terminal domain-like protein [Modestobacter sp. DSM 44400]SDX90382.1 L-alanine-DL-glutamate epimerase [Modestobacter sp. DSM 44400]
MNRPEPTVTDVRTAVYRFPTPVEEGDGTLTWNATTAVTVEVDAGDCTGLGWTYSSPAAAEVVGQHLAGVVTGRAALDVPGAWSAMHRAGRNLGTRGLFAQALSAVDIALWDLKARLLGVPLVDLFGKVRDSVPVYGSGGFTTLSDEELEQQVAGWRAAGCTAMKIKIGESWGTRLGRDLTRVRQLRELAGDGVDLMVDANGGYSIGQARRVGAVLDELGVVWFEEPVSSDDLPGLALLRGVLDCDIAAGEYLSDVVESARMLPSVDCLQLDVTRCGGYTGWLRCADLAPAAGLQVSGHCAPSLHAPVAAALPWLRHVEWFVDHARLEPKLVEGAPEVSDGALHLTDRPGHGMTLRPDASRWQVAGR